MMAQPQNPRWQISLQGDRTLMLSLDADISVEAGLQCAALALALRKENLRGVLDIVPGFNTVAVHYQPRLFGSSTSFQSFAIEITRLIDTPGNTLPVPQREIEIPVCYEEEFGPDLPGVARHCGLSIEETIALHCKQPVYVFMLGFAPGAAYMGLHDAALNITRRNTPRTAVPKGSVAIANCQSIIYPNESPGGWHVIGTTPASLFFPHQYPPTRFEPGDTVRFVPISKQEFHAYKDGQ